MSGGETNAGILSVAAVISYTNAMRISSVVRWFFESSQPQKDNITAEEDFHKEIYSWRDQ